MIQTTDTLARLKAVAQANIQTARDNGSTPGVSQQFYRGRASAFEEMVRAIEALEGSWEKKARELSEFMTRGGFYEGPYIAARLSDIGIKHLTSALREAYESGYEQGEQSGPNKPERH